MFEVVPESSATVRGSTTAVGLSLTGVTVIVNVCGALASIPPLAVPPSSFARRPTVAVPFAFAASVYVSVPLVATVGTRAEQGGLVFDVISKVTIWAALVGGPGADGRRPAGDGLRAGILEDGLVRALGEARVRR